MDKEKIRQIFPYTAEEASKVPSEERDKIIREFWDRCDKDPDLSAMLDDISGYAMQLSDKKATKLEKTSDLHAVSMVVVTRSLPFYDPDASHVNTFLHTRINNAIDTKLRSTNSQNGISRSTVKVRKAIQEMEQKTGEEFNFTKPEHKKFLMDQGFTPTKIRHAKDTAEILSLDTPTADGGSHYDAIADTQILSPVDYLEQTELFERLKQAFNSLSPEMQDIFTLRHNDDKSLKEIAAQHGTSISNISKMLAKATKKVADEAGFDVSYLKKTNKTRTPVAEAELSL